jgi:hypothetical protein
VLESSISSQVAEYWSLQHEVPGAFWNIDFALFDMTLQWQEQSGVRGDLLEVGALFGKSSIVLGRHARADETVHICDVFEDPAVDAANDSENDVSYAGLTRASFEANYARFVDRKPHIIQSLSSSLPHELDPDSLRFVHVDGGHLYDVVADDVANAELLSGANAVVVFDDYRAIHTPGVAAAVWAAADRGPFIPVVASEQKLYGTWDESSAAEYFERASSWAGSLSDQLHFGVQSLRGRPFLVIANPHPTTSSVRGRLARLLPPVVTDRLRPAPPPPYLGT